MLEQGRGELIKLQLKIRKSLYKIEIKVKKGVDHGYGRGLHKRRGTYNRENIRYQGAPGRSTPASATQKQKQADGSISIGFEADERTKVEKKAN